MTSLVELLEQRQVWHDGDGRVYYLGELSNQALRGAVTLLEGHATRLAEHHRRAHDTTSALDDASALTWLRARPLYRALVAEAQRRDATCAVVDVDLDTHRRLDELARLLYGYHDLIVRLNDVLGRR